MTFISILFLVLIAAILLAILFTFFHILIGLIPIAFVVAIVIWLINRFSKNNKSEQLTNDQYFYYRKESNGRKRARNVKTKDIDH